MEATGDPLLTARYLRRPIAERLLSGEGDGRARPCELKSFTVVLCFFQTTGTVRTPPPWSRRTVTATYRSHSRRCDVPHPRRGRTGNGADRSEETQDPHSRSGFDPTQVPPNNGSRRGKFRIGGNTSGRAKTVFAQEPTPGGSLIATISKNDINGFSTWQDSTAQESCVWSAVFDTLVEYDETYKLPVVSSNRGRRPTRSPGPSRFARA